MFKLPPSSFTFSIAFRKATALMLKPERDERMKLTLNNKMKAHVFGGFFFSVTELLQKDEEKQFHTVTYQLKKQRFTQSHC